MPVPVLCSCGHQLPVHAEAAGREVRCPACGALRTSTGTGDIAPGSERIPEGGIKTEPPSPGKVVEEVLEAGPASRPRKKTRKGGDLVKLLIAALVAVVVLGGVGLLVWILMGGANVAPDLAFVPGDAQMFAALKVVALADTPLAKEVLATLPGGKQALDDVTSKIGLKTTDIDRLLVVVQDADARQIWVVVTAFNPLDRKKILDGLEVDPAERKQQNRAYHVNKKGGNELAVHFVNDRTFVLGREDVLKVALSKVSGFWKTGQLAKSLKLVDNKTHLVMAVAPPAAELQKAKQTLQARPLTSQYASLLDLQGVSLTGYIGGTARSLQVVITVHYPSETQAGTAQAAFEAFRGQAKQMLARLPDPGKKAAAQKILGPVGISQQGSDVLLTGNVDYKISDVLMLANEGMAASEPK